LTETAGRRIFSALPSIPVRGQYTVFGTGFGGLPLRTAVSGSTVSVGVGSGSGSSHGHARSCPQGVVQALIPSVSAMTRATAPAARCRRSVFLISPPRPRWGGVARQPPGLAPHPSGSDPLRLSPFAQAGGLR
jgi:hypothetical protein